MIPRTVNEEIERDRANEDRTAAFYIPPTHLHRHDRTDERTHDHDHDDD